MKLNKSMSERKNIIGNGDIASVLPDREDLVFFASGVSNSQETRESEYEREKNLLLSQDTSKHLVYFSSLAVFYSKTRYASHKKEMEELVKTNFSPYTIIRLGNIDWGDNPHTLINHLRDKIYKREPYEVQNVYRYVLDKKEFLHWIDLIPSWSCEMNIPGRRLTVRQISTEIRAHLL
jgi:nucleoside-diphosphate-sugar epimerase